MSESAFPIEDLRRRHLIRRYIREHPGCIKTNIIKDFEKRDFHNKISKKTIDKLVPQMEEDGLIDIIKEKPSRKGYKIYLREDNLLNYVPLQLDEFEIAFVNNLANIKQKITEYNIHKKHSKNQEHRSEKYETAMNCYSKCMRLLDDISNVYLAYCSVVWPHEMDIKDKDMLRKLYYIIFTKIADIRIKVYEVMSPFFSLRRSGYINAIFGLYATEKIVSDYEEFDKIGLKKESQPLFDSLWKIYKDVHMWAFPEIGYYDWNISFDDGYERFIEECKLHPDRILKV